MSYDPDLERTGPLQRIQEWWLALPLGRRINVALYGLAAVAVLFLLGAVFSGGEEPSEVAAGGTTTSTTSTAGATTSRPTTTTTVGVTTTAAPSSSAAAPSTTLRATTTTRPTGSGTTQTTVATSTTVAPSTTAPDCRNSGNPACGEFRWDPSPGTNEPLTVLISASTPTPQPGAPVTFTFTVADPDHLVDSTCAVIDWGDGSAPTQGSCPAPPACPPAFGPWTPPARQAGNHSPSFSHTYAQPGSYTIVANFTSVNQNLCPALDPYRSTGQGSLGVSVTIPTTTSTSTTTTTLPPSTTTSTPSSSTSAAP